MADRSFPSVTLEGLGLRLRAPSSADIPAIAEACVDELIQTWLPLPRPYTEADARWFCLEFAPAQQASGDGLVLVVELEGRLAGVIDLKDTDWRDRSTEIGYWTAPWARGRGVMTAAVCLLARWVLTERGFARVAIRAAVGNRASRRVAERAGFTEEGVLRSAGHTHGGRVDLVLYSFIEADLATAAPPSPVRPVG